VPLHRSLFLPVLFAIETVMHRDRLAASTATVFVRTSRTLSMITGSPLHHTDHLPDQSSCRRATDLVVTNPLFPLFASYQVIIGGGGIDYSPLPGDLLGRRPRHRQRVAVPPVRARAAAAAA
jgi:hypothetical protein